MKYCRGCGVTIQRVDINSVGYSPVDGDYCQRCFKLTHYNKIEKFILERDKYIDLINEITKKKALYVLVADAFAFDTSVDAEVLSLLEKRDWILVLNKFDVFPKSLNRPRLIASLLKKIKKTYLACIATSAAKNSGIDELVGLIDQHYRGRDVYFLGAVNVGKSSLLNCIMSSRVVNHKAITTSKHGGTTADLLPIPFFIDGSMLMDTPGFVPKGGFLNYQETASFIPNKEIKTQIYQLREPKAFLISDFMKIEVYPAGESSIVFYIANELHIHRTNIDKARMVFNEEDKKCEKPFLIPAKSDFVLAELGFIYFPSRVNILVSTYEGVDLLVRKSIIFSPDKKKSISKI